MSGTNQTFRQLLSQATDAVERPRPIADGHYIGTIKGHEFGQSRQQATPYVRFTHTVEEACQDVDQTENEGIDFSTKEMTKTFYITPKSLYRLSDYLDAVLGEQQGRSFDERIPECRGVRVMYQVTHHSNEAGTEKYNDVGSVVKADAETISEETAAAA